MVGAGHGLLDILEMLTPLELENICTNFSVKKHGKMHLPGVK